MHRFRRLPILSVVLALFVSGVSGAAAAASQPQQQSSAAAGVARDGVDGQTAFDREAVSIFAMLNKQAADWNRGDIDAFASGYKDSPDILFIGSRIARGYAAMLANYKAHYPTREKMGMLSFTQLAVQALDARFATATGHFHLERSVAGGGPADGYFLLVLERTPAGWKIVRDDTTSLYPGGATH